MAHAKGNAVPAVREPIAVRSTKLNHLLLGRGSGQLANRHLASRDSLLDALFALYDECNREQLRRDKNIALFLDKYQGIVTELRQLRVSISDFEMKAVIGRGHFGDIHMVKEKATGDIYAMKILRKDYTLSQREVAFYEEERDVLVRAPQGGPWLVQLQYAFQDASHLYLVMEFLPGGDLFGLLDRSGPALPEEDARFYLAELVLALHALHTLGYVHRDVKPDNVLIDRTGHIKLADFGSAAKLADRKSMGSRMPVGTPHYVAPEVLSAVGGGPAAPRAHGTACDWWSLGVLGYEMLFGQNPFAGDRITVTYNNIMNFQDSLTFPKEAEVSETAVRMLQGLLTSADRRFSYQDVCGHTFFASVDWNNIRQTVPPFVPSLSGEEDTSNFDEFEQETPRPRVPALRDQKKGFEGSSLPFVGFTHTQCATGAALDRTVSFLEVGSPRRESPNVAGRQQRGQPRERASSAREEALQQEVQGSQARLREAQEARARLERQLQDAEAREAHLRADNQNLNMLVSLERQGRLVSEEKAVQLVGALKRKYRRQDELLRSGHFVPSPKIAAPSVEEVDDSGGEEQTDGVGTRESAPEQEKERLERELQKERSRCSKYKEHLNRILAEGKDCMEEMQKKHKSNLEYIDGVRKEVAEAVEKQRRAEQALDVCREECSSHREKVAVLEKQLASLKLQATASLEATGKEGGPSKAEQPPPAPTSCLECAVALGRLEAVLEERDRLVSEAAQLRCRLSGLQEARVSSEPSGSKSELQREAEGLRSVVTRLERVARAQEPAVRPPAMSGSGDNNGLAQVAQAQAEKLNTLEKQARDLEEANARYVKEIERLNIEVQRLAKSPVVEAAACLATDDAKTLVASLGAEAQPLTSEATAALESQLAKTREFLSTSRARCGELQLQLRKKEEALSEAQLDARIARREAKRSEEGEAALKGRLGEASQELEVLRKAEGELRTRVAQLQAALQREERQAATAKLGYEKELAKLEERVQMLRDNCGTAKNLEAKCTTTADECRDLTIKCKVLELEAQREAETRARVERDSQELEEELRKERAKTDKLIKTLQLMKDTCEELERQVVAYETMYQEAEKKVANFDAERATHEDTVDKLNKKNALLKESLMLEKAARRRQEEELEEHRAGDGEASATLESLRRALSEREALLEQMGAQVLSLRRELGDQEASARALRRREEGLQGENLAIKEEASRHITTIASLKSSNLTLSQELEECRARHADTLDYVEQLESELDGQKSFAETEMLKLNQTLAQQTKLIDFLQTKVAELDKKKKKFFGGGRSGKEGTLARTDAEGALERERSKCRRLQDQLDSARAEAMLLRQQLSTAAAAGTDAGTLHSSKLVSVPTSPRSRALLTALTMSPSTNMDSRGGVPSEEGEPGGGAPKGPPLRMQHNIPHRFQVVLCMRGTKCAACLDSVHFGRYASRCEECQAVCHPKCSTLVPSTCGVPAEYVRQFSDSVSCQQSSPPALGRHVRFAPGLSEVTFDQLQPQGWVKLPRGGGKPGWDRCFLALRGDTLYVLGQAVDGGTDEGTLASLCRDRLCLNPPDGEALVSSAVSASELLGTAKTDLPYTFKLELRPTSTCWPSRCLYIMVPTFEEKQMWVSVLEECVGKNLDAACKNTLGDTVLLLEGDQVLDVNCTYELSFEYLLLGAMEGLFVVDLVGCSVRRKVADVPAVFQIGLARRLGVVLAILGEERKLKLAQWDSLRPWVESRPGIEVSPAPSWRLVEDIGECHLFALSEDGATLCVATAKTVHLMHFNPASGNYSRRKLVNTSEPCSCIHFTPFTILIGTDTFYEIDAKDYSIEPFLDPTDTSLSFLMYGATQLRSFPVAILQLAPPEYNPEYLLCFHELGVFVDQDGRRTREDDLKWKRLPLAFAYKAPHLFIGHFNAVEILEIKPRGSKDSGLHRTVLVSQPRFLGLSHLGSMYVASFGPRQVRLLSVNAACESALPSTKASLENGAEECNEELEFSFTSSVVEMLDD